MDPARPERVFVQNRSLGVDLSFANAHFIKRAPCTSLARGFSCATRVATGTRYATLQNNLGYDMFLVIGKSAHSVNSIVIAGVVTFGDLNKLTSNLGYVLREPVHATRMLFNLSIT